MRKTVFILILASVFATGSALASGWRIPEQSVDSTARSGANIASSSRADSAYYNPANMSWMADVWHLEIDATYIHLSPIKYKDSRTSRDNGQSEAENFLIPTGFAVSPFYGDMRFGLSVVAPYGLSKRWQTPLQKSLAEEFSLQVIEVGPTVSYSINDMVSVAAGPRMVYASAKVKSDASGIGVPLSQYIEGDTLELGWNVAIAVNPMEKLNISSTYRSYVDLDFADKAKLNLLGTRLIFDTKVSVPLPAVFALSIAYDVLDRLKVELTWDRTFWSQYDNLDFDFLPNIPGNPFEPSRAKSWDDTDAFRIGLTYKLNDTISLMGGLGYDKNPAPTEKIGFELPDSDAFLTSLGMRYRVNESMDLGIAALYDYKKSRRVEINANDKVYGEFTNASGFLMTVGLNYTF